MSSRKKKIEPIMKRKKPNHNDFSVRLGLNDRLCIKLRDGQYNCMQIKDWLQKNPQAVLVENVVNKGPQLRAEVYALFAQKVQRVDLVKERLRYQTFLQEVHKNELKVVLQ